MTRIHSTKIGHKEPNGFWQAAGKINAKNGVQLDLFEALEEIRLYPIIPGCKAKHKHKKILPQKRQACGLEPDDQVQLPWA